MIEFSVAEIEDSLDCCRAAHANVAEKLSQVRSGYSRLKEALTKEKNGAKASVSAAEAELRSANDTMEKNAALADRSRRAITELQNEIRQQEARIESINRSIAALRAQASAPPPAGENEKAKPPDNSGAIAALESQKNGIRAAIACHERRIAQLNLVITRTQKANEELVQVKHCISASISALKEHASRCAGAIEAIAGYFSSLEYRADKAEGQIGSLCEKILKTAGYARSATRTLSELYLAGNQPAVYDSSEIRVDSTDDLYRVINELSAACIALDTKEHRLQEVLKQYKRSIDDNVSREVIAVVTRIDRSLKEIYGLLRRKEGLTRKFAADLEGYRFYL